MIINIDIRVDTKLHRGEVLMLDYDLEKGTLDGNKIQLSDNMHYEYDGVSMYLCNLISDDDPYIDYRSNDTYFDKVKDGTYDVIYNGFNHFNFMQDIKALDLKICDYMERHNLDNEDFYDITIGNYEILSKALHYARNCMQKM